MRLAILVVLTAVALAPYRLWRELRGRIRERWCRPSTHWYVREGRGETIYQPIWQRPPKAMVVGRVQVRAAPALGCNV
jgi:hypothetical protein